MPILTFNAIKVVFWNAGVMRNLNIGLNIGVCQPLGFVIGIYAEIFEYISSNNNFC